MIESAPLPLPHHALLKRRKEVKKTVLCLALVLLFVGVAHAQTKSMTGTVIDYTVGNRGTWAGITIKVGNKKYFIYTESIESPAPKVVGKVDEVGRTVQVFYTRVVNSTGLDGELRATRIVEVESSSRRVAPRGAQPESSELRIGAVDNSNYRYLDGCGCYLKAPSASRNSHSYIFLAKIANPNVNRAWMNIDGRVMALNFISSTQRPGRIRRGSTYTETYRSGDVTARVTYVVTSPSRPGGEVAKYSATITVTKGGRSQTVKAVGECGC